MREPNARVRPRGDFQLSLDGRQVASVVVGALVVLGLVFVLGMNVGKHVALRQGSVRIAGDLEALDRAPAPPAVAEPLTFHDRLTKATPLPPAPEPAVRPSAPPTAQPAAAATPAATPAATAAATAPPTATPPNATPTTQAPTATATPAATPTPATTPAGSVVAARTTAQPATLAAAKAPDRPWTVQLAAAQDRREAERIAARFAALRPRIEEADVPGKGRFYRVRAGAFDSREAAERYLRDAARESGAKGFVTPSR